MRNTGSNRRERRRYIPKRKVCPFCVDRSRKIDYKEADQLRRFISDRGKMEPRHRTGVCAKHQRRLSIALKRARHLALCHTQQSTFAGAAASDLGSGKHSHTSNPDSRWQPQAPYVSRTAHSRKVIHLCPKRGKSALIG